MRSRPAFQHQGPDANCVIDGLTLDQVADVAEDDFAPTSDPDPAATDADSGGRPLTDAEVDALPVEEA